MNIVYTDVLVIGGGLAGLRMAIGAKRRGHEAIILSLVPAKRSHSKAAQGGMQASLGNVIKGQGDNEDVHFEDTVRGSDWGADQEVVRMFVNTAPKAVRELAAWGVPWSRIRRGDRDVIINGKKVTITERDAAHGTVAQRDFGGTKKWRTCYVSDGTGHAMLNAVADRAIADSIPVLERVEALALIHDNERVGGQGQRTHRTRESHCDCHRRRGPHLSRHHQCSHLRGHGPRHRARNRRCGARQHGSGAVPPDRDLSSGNPRHRGLPR
jgi:fumarate reductase flavoprotein subunit